MARERRQGNRENKRRWAIGIVCLATSSLLNAQTFETTKLVVPPAVDDIAFQESFGDAVSAVEGMAWVGEPLDNVCPGTFPGTDGSIFGFRRSSSGWRLVANIHAREHISSQVFGDGLAFTDEFGVVGASYDSPLGHLTGAAHLLVPAGDTWVEVSRVYPDAVEPVRLGEVVSISGERVLISARGDDDAGDNKGAAYIFKRNGRDLVLEQKLIPRHPDSPGWGAASLSLDIHGDVAALGAYEGSHGMVLVFEHTANGWIESAILQEPTPDNWSEFGAAVAVDDGVIAVGKPVPLATVFFFERQGPPPGNWVLTQEVHASNASYASGGDKFGTALDFHEGRLLVGAPRGKVGNEVRGTAYLFERDASGTWVETRMFAPSDVSDTEVGFGYSVSLSASYALIGAPYAIGSIPGIRSGAAYVYELPLGVTTCSGVPNSTGVPGHLQVTGSLKASVSALELWADDLPRLQFGMFLIGSDPGFVSGPGGSQGNLCLGGNIGRFKQSLAGTGLSGELHHTVDTKALPLPPPAEILPGETWYFQAWYRDVNPTATSNFTDTVAVTFR